MTTRADKALNAMRDTKRRMEICAARKFDQRATSLAYQLNTQALVAIAELLAEARPVDDVHSWHPAAPDVPHDGWAVAR